jgi:hypothetical protein
MLRSREARIDILSTTRLVTMDRDHIRARLQRLDSCII